MADTIVITKKIGGAVVITTANVEYTHDPRYKIRNQDDKVKIYSEVGSLVETLDPVEVEKVVLIDGTEIAIADADTLFATLLASVFVPSSEEQPAGAFATRVDEDINAGTTTTYIGTALPGTLDADAKWQIKKVVEVIAGNATDTTITYPESAGDASRELEFVWNDRLGFTYS